MIKGNPPAAGDPGGMEAFSFDSFFNGRIRLKQSRRGYRYSIDAVILAGALRVRPGERVVDLGAGCGIVSLILACREPDARIWAVEIQPQLALLAKENVASNGMAAGIEVLEADMRQLGPGMLGGPVDRVVANPPYRRGRSGRLNPNAQRARARHEISITLPELVGTARRVLKTGGWLTVIYSADRSAELLFQMRTETIEPKRFRSVHSSPGADARLVLVEGIKGGRPGVSIAPPLMIYNVEGGYSEEIRSMFLP
jgi:tRNA1Val (adenine37-N6)-methyltransferase